MFVFFVGVNKHVYRENPEVNSVAFKNFEKGINQELLKYCISKE